MNGKIFKSENERLNCVAHQFYKEYMQFMDFNKELNFESLYNTKSEDIEFGKVVYPKQENGIYKILISKRIKELNSNSKKAFLYHEFTHIKDRIISKELLIEQQKLNMAYFIYTEFHASRVETMALLNFNNYSDHKAITHDSKIYFEYDTKPSTIEKFLLKQQDKENNNFQVHLHHYRDFSEFGAIKEANEEYYEMLRCLAYYLGHMDLFIETTKFTDYINLTSFSEVLGNEVYDIQNILHKQPELELNSLTKVKELENKVLRNVLKL